jgi:hypothetical protein
VSVKRGAQLASGTMPRFNAEKETLGEIARSYNVSRWTISRLSA